MEMHTFKSLALCQIGILVLSEDPWLVSPDYTLEKTSINLATTAPSYASVDTRILQETSKAYVEEQCLHGCLCSVAADDIPT